MFDPATLKLIRKIDVGQGPDGIYYEPATKRVFTNNHGTHDITAIDAATGNVVGTVKLAGDGEQAVIGKDGLIYVNVEDAAEVVVFDPRALVVKRRMPIGVAETPTALAYDAQTNQLFIACREKPMLVVMDATSGKVTAHFPIEAGVDYAGFDATARRLFFACGAGTLHFFDVKASGQVVDAGTLATQPSAKTLAFDAKTGRIFLPAAEYVSGADGKRAVKPGSFTVLVVGK
jgi:DNA-binding beta-propeller fold protein YncE